MLAPGFEVISLPGLQSFQKVYALQLDLLEKRIRDQIPDTLLFCEHTPVITRGRGLQFNVDRAVRSTPLLQIQEGTEYFEIERGGDLTWHGPGQLVVYPIVKLGGEGPIGKQVGQDVGRWIRFLENVWIEGLKDFKIEAISKPGGSGVWIDQKKVASVGIALRRWVNYHGIAINVVNDLAPFYDFDPCGFRSEVMTRLQDMKGFPQDAFRQEWKAFWTERFLQSLTQLVFMD